MLNNLVFEVGRQILLMVHNLLDLTVFRLAQLLQVA